MSELKVDGRAQELFSASSGAQHMATSSQIQHLLQHGSTEDSNYLGTHTVLLCDDDPVTLRTVEQLLRKFGYKVVTATNARDAIRHLEASKAPGGQQIDLVLTDVLMPEVSGLDLMHEVIHGTLFSDVPVVVMSSQDSQESVLQAFEAGASDYLIKPLRRNEVATLWQHVWRANRFKAHKDGQGSEPAAVGDSAADRQKFPDGATASEQPTANLNSGGSNAETDHGSNEAGSVFPGADNKPPLSSGPHSGSATNTVVYSEQHAHQASRFSQQANAQSRADNAASGPSSGDNTVYGASGPAAANHSQRQRNAAQVFQGGDNADACTDAAVVTTESSLEDEPASNQVRHPTNAGAAAEPAQDQRHHHHHHNHHSSPHHKVPLQQVTSGGVSKAMSSVHAHHASKPDGPTPASDVKPEAQLHHAHSHQQKPSRPIADRSNSHSNRALQELAVLGQTRQEQREQLVGHGSEGTAGLHRKADSHMVVVQQHKAIKQEVASEAVPDTMWQELDQQRQQEEEDAETAEAAGLLLGVAAAAVAEQQAARRAAHASTAGSGRNNRSNNNASHGNGGWGASGGHGRASGNMASSSASAGAAGCTAGQAGRSTFSALTVFLPRNLTPTLPAAASGALPSSDGDGAAPNPSANHNHTQHHSSGRHHSSSLEPEGPSTTQASGYATTPGSSSFLSTPTANGNKAVGHPMPSMPLPERPMEMEMNNHAASMFMHPGAPLMLPQSIMPLLAYSLAGMHPDLQQSMFMAHGMPPTEHPHSFMDGSMAQHAAMQHHVMPSVVLVAGRGDATSTAAAHRRAAVQKYLQKKKNRNFKKKVRYESRKRLAEARPRVRGQFVKQDPVPVVGAPAASKGGSAAEQGSALTEPSSSGNKQSREDADHGVSNGVVGGPGRGASRLKKRQRQGSVMAEACDDDDKEERVSEEEEEA